MDKENIINEIKENLKKLFSFTQKFNNYTLTDGTNITSPAEELEIGVEVYGLDENGNQTPLNDGEFVLQDGRTITLKENKIVDIKGEVKQPEEEVSVTEEEQSMADSLPEVEVEAPEVEVEVGADMVKRVEALEKNIEEILSILSKMGDAQMKVNEDFENKIEKFGAEPGGEAIKANKKGYVPYEKDKVANQEKIESFNELKELMNKMRKNS